MALGLWIGMAGRFTVWREKIDDWIRFGRPAAMLR